MKYMLKVAIFVLVIGMVAMPSFADPSIEAGYSATVVTGQNTGLIVHGNNFGSILVNSEKILINSLTLNNTGDLNATVDARFLSIVSSTYGLVNSTYNNSTYNTVIGAGNFSLRNNTGDSTWHNLSNDGSDIRITTVALHTEKDLDARLFVPSVAIGGIYNGTVLLIFGNEY